MPTSTIEDNDRLLARLQQGDDAARQEMIERNMPLVVKCVERMVKRHPRLRRHFDDLIGTGFLALTTGVDFLKSNRTDHPTGYLKTVIYRALCKEICQNGLVRISQQTMNRWKQQGRLEEATQLPIVQSLEMLQTDNVHGHETVDPALIQDDPNLESFETLEALFQCCRTDLEREIVRLRSQHLTMEEVGKQVQRDPDHISRILSRIQRRYLEQ